MAYLGDIQSHELCGVRTRKPASGDHSRRWKKGRKEAAAAEYWEGRLAQSMASEFRNMRQSGALWLLSLGLAVSCSSVGGRGHVWASLLICSGSSMGPWAPWQ